MRILTTLLVLLLAGPAAGQVIGTVTGVQRDGGTVTINGVGFGSRPIVEAESFFERFNPTLPAPTGDYVGVRVDSTLNANMDPSKVLEWSMFGIWPGWSDVEARNYWPWIFEDAGVQRQGSGYSAMLVEHWDDNEPLYTGRANLALIVDGYTLDVGDKAFLSLWVRTTFPGAIGNSVFGSLATSCPQQMKWVESFYEGRLNDPPYVGSTWQSSDGGAPNHGVVRTYVSPGLGDADNVYACDHFMDQWPMPDEFDENKSLQDAIWLNYELALGVGTNNTADTYIATWLNGEYNYDDSVVGWNAADSNVAAALAENALYKRSQVRFHMPYNVHPAVVVRDENNVIVDTMLVDPNCWTHLGYAPFDSALVDDWAVQVGTWARVALAPSGNFNAAGHDYQEIVSWSDDQIVITLNAPSTVYGDQDTGWLYVITDAGTISAGAPIIIGADVGEPPGTPGIPVNLQAIEN